MIRLGQVVLCAAFLLVAGSRARADDATAEAQALFKRAGVELAHANWSEAERLLRRSVELHPNVGTVYNLTTALEGQRRFREGIAVLEALLSEKWGPLSESERTEVKARVDLWRPRLARLVVVVREPSLASISIEGIDGSFPTQAGVATIDVDPGTTHIRVEASAYLGKTLDIDAPSARTTRVDVSLERAPVSLTPSPSAVAAAADPASSTGANAGLEKDSSSEGGSEWIWWTGGAVVAVAAAAVVIVVLSSGDAKAKPVEVPYFEVTSALAN